MRIPCDPELVEMLRSRTRLAGVRSTDGFAFDLDLSTPGLALAIHAGHNVRAELLPLMLITEPERFFEEDPATDRMIQGPVSAIWALDSRAEYDLNRPYDEAVPLTPEQFWGIRVYREQPTSAMIRRSLDQYNAFYRFLGGCITVLLERFGRCIVYDLHSYNISRQIKKGFIHPPLFNLGTAQLDRERWSRLIDAWLTELAAIVIPGISTTVAENMVFAGKGELCRRLCDWDPRILVLPTEIAKVYMDEHTGVIDSPTVEALHRGLDEAIAAHSRIEQL